MNPFDVVIVVIPGFCLIRGIFRGLVKEISSIVGVLAGFYGAYTYYDRLAVLLSGWISNTSYLNILSSLIIFCLILIAVNAAAVIIKYFLKISFLGWIDRICGALFGLVKGIALVSVLFIILTTFLPKGTPMIKESYFSPLVTTVSENMAKVVSKDMKKQFQSKINELKRIWSRRK